MTRPTTLKLHDFPEESFIHGCYIPDHICDDLIKYFDENPDKHAKGEVYGTGDKLYELIEDVDIKDSLDINFSLNQDEHTRVMSEYIQYLDLCIR